MGQWFVVRTKVGQEDKAVWHLKNQKFDVYLPKYCKKVHHARKTKSYLRPLFPGYLFIKIDIDRQPWRSINGTIGVIGLLQFGATPQHISSELIDEIRTREENGVVNISPAGFVKGEAVHACGGALAEYTAFFEEHLDEKRVVLLLNLMGREVRVTVPPHQIVKA